VSDLLKISKRAGDRAGICTWAIWSFSQEVDYPSRNSKVLSSVLENLLDLNTSLSFLKILELI